MKQYEQSTIQSIVSGLFVMLPSKTFTTEGLHCFNIIFHVEQNI